MELSRRQTGKHPLRWPTDPMCFFDSQKAGAREQNAASDCTAPALSPLLSKTSLRYEDKLTMFLTRSEYGK